MFLMYYGGKLVFASGTLGRDGTTAKDLDSAIEHALQDAAKQNFLPDDFKFGLQAGQVCLFQAFAFSFVSSTVRP